MSDEIHVKIGGSAIYKAVANYLKDNEGLKSQITALVDKAGADGQIAATVKAELERAVRNTWALNSEVKNAVKEILTAQVKLDIDAMVQASVKKALDNAIFIMPKLPETK